jgi:RNA polymerase sigma-70 factor (ECF subfamily)
MPETTSAIENALSRLAIGDLSARNTLFEHAYRRLERLAHARLRQFPRLADTGDVLNTVILRLNKALQDVHPNTVAEFFGLAALYTRRTLLTLKEKRQTSQQEYEAEVSDAGPQTCVEQQDLQDRLAQLVEELPQEMRQVVDLMFYQDLTQRETAILLSVDVRTVKRRWRQARLRLAEVLGDVLHDSPTEDDPAEGARS